MKRQASPQHQSWLKLPSVEPADGPLADEFEKAKQTHGYVQNAQLTLGHNPDRLLAFAAYRATFKAKPGLTLTEREKYFVAVVVSVENRCDACIFGNGLKLRQLTNDPIWEARVEINYRKLKLSPRDRAIADFAVKLTTTPHEMQPADLDTLRSVGMTEMDLLELVEWVGIYNLTNRLVAGLGIEPDVDAYFQHRSKVD